MIAYSELHPVSPGLEKMLARVVQVSAIAGGVKVGDEPIPFADHLIRKYPNEN
ncbi:MULTISPECIES: hypothetical protein [Luteibacter]|uniref:hypothetical protein n=1 Tax=Luteibacter TaxID=242605 RepID=UPI000B17AF9B|nr:MULTISPECIES: hypothetical protein [unclassified Luteibacter]